MYTQTLYVYSKTKTTKHPYMNETNHCSLKERNHWQITGHNLGNSNI